MKRQIPAYQEVISKITLNSLIKSFETMVKKKKQEQETVQQNYKHERQIK